MSETRAPSPLPKKTIERIIAELQRQTATSWAVPPPQFYARPTESVCCDLLGALLLHAQREPSGELKLCGGTIVEVEAYLGRRDPACHSVPRILAALGGAPAPGLAYVYLIYSVHHCFNIVTLPEGNVECVLVRALEPVLGLEVMAARRGVRSSRARELCSGPAKLCQALAIDLRHNGCSVARGPLLVLKPAQSASPAVARGPRVGIVRATDWPLRFWVSGSPWVSRGASG